MAASAAPLMGADQQLVLKPGTAAPILDDAVPQQVNLVAPLIPVPVQPAVLLPPALDVAVPQHLNVVAPPLIPIPVPSVSVPQVGAPALAPGGAALQQDQVVPVVVAGPPLQQIPMVPVVVAGPPAVPAQPIAQPVLGLAMPLQAAVVPLAVGGPPGPPAGCGVHRTRMRDANLRPSFLK